MVDVQSSRPRGFVAQAKAQPGKTATLCVLVMMMTMIWGRALIGGKETAKPEATPVSQSSSTATASMTPETRVAKVQVPASPKGEISNYATAVARLDSWRRPLGIENAEVRTEGSLASHLGEAGERPLAESEDQALAAHDALNPLELTTQAETEPTVSTAPLLVDEDIKVDMTLSGTLLLGDTRFALFGDRRIQEGEQFGRYLLQAVRPREVDLIVDGKLTVVRIAPPNLGSDN